MGRNRPELLDTLENSAGRLSPGSKPSQKPLKVTAVITFRNEEAYLAQTLRHLLRNNVSVFLMDNGSTDNSRRICESPEFESIVAGIRDLPFYGTFDLTRQLAAKLAVISELDADWVIHADADELMQSPREGETLRDGIARHDAAGFNVIDFDEFVFLPLEGQLNTPNGSGLPSARHYYFFQPVPLRLMRAWKGSAGLSMVEGGGHRLSGERIVLAPEQFILRHYPFHSAEHAATKYANRSFAPAELARGWHVNRVGQPPENFAFPAPSTLEHLADPNSRKFIKSRPHKLHYWQWPPGKGAGGRT